FALDGVSEVSEVEVTLVTMRNFDDEEAQGYVATGEPLGKAGAYAIQGLGGELVDHIEGSFTNVMGLPLDTVLGHLEQLFPAALSASS
ncbi:MAG: Maf family protein, partial [Acidimicrobiia bacterium]